MLDGNLIKRLTRGEKQLPLVASQVWDRGDIVDAYREHAGGYYRKNGDVTSEVSCVDTVSRFLEPYRDELAMDFGPLKLKRVRDAMVEAKIVRDSINKHMGRVKRLFRWAVSEELIPADTLTALETVEGLRKGRSNAVESEPVLPVSINRVEAVRPFVSRPIWGLIQFQLLTGCRPGEALIVRGCDIDRTGEKLAQRGYEIDLTRGGVWVYIPESHKTEHHNRDRFVVLGPKAVSLVEQFGLATIIWLFLYDRATGWFDSNVNMLRNTQKELDKFLGKQVFAEMRGLGRKPRLTTVFRSGRFAIVFAAFSLTVATYLFVDAGVPTDTVKRAIVWAVWGVSYLSFASCLFWLPSTGVARIPIENAG